MMKRLKQWFAYRWRRQDEEALRNAYHLTFSSLHGQQVLQHLLDTVYCQVYEGTNPQECLIFNAKRALVHDILVNIDMAELPSKYRNPIEEAISL